MKTTRRWALACGVCVLIIGCVPKDRGASDAYKRRQYDRSAEIYQQLLLEKPGDADLIALRDRARSKHYERYLTAMKRVEKAPEQLVPLMSTLLSQRDRWTPGQKSLGAPQLDAFLSALQNGIDQWIEADLRRELTARRLLTAASRVEHYQAALPFADFRERWTVLHGEVRRAAESKCREAMPAEPERSPYLTSLLASYCTALRAPIPPVIDLGLAAGLQVKISVEGANAAQVAAAQNALAMSFLEGAWYDPASKRQLAGAITGASTLGFTARQERLSAPWSRRESYLANETYQQPYTTYEHYTERVSRTVYRTQSYSCGTYKSPRTCTRSSPSTEYHTEHRSRPVTKHRTATRLVTRHRDVQETHHYRAIRRDGAYDARWQVAVDFNDLPGGPSLSFAVSASIRQHGYDHDESFVLAKVAPSRANLMTAPQWFDYVAQRLADQLHEQLELRWRSSFCQLPSYTLETAARCTRGAAAPAAARFALSQLFGGDTDLVLSRMTRWGARRPNAPDPASATK
jgi:hypothetical protein